MFTGPDMLIDVMESEGACNYLFANNNPLVFVDPTGLEPEDIRSLRVGLLSEELADVDPGDFGVLSADPNQRAHEIMEGRMGAAARANTLEAIGTFYAVDAALTVSGGKIVGFGGRLCHGVAVRCKGAYNWTKTKADDVARWWRKSDDKVPVGGAVDDLPDLLPRNGSLPVQQQVTNNYTCGPNSVEMVLDTLIPDRQVSAAFDYKLVPDVGTKITYVAKALVANGVSVKHLKRNLDYVKNATKGPNPVIAHVKLPDGGGHFLVVDGVTKRHGKEYVAIRDSAGGRMYFESVESCSKRFSGWIVKIYGKM